MTITTLQAPFIWYCPCEMICLQNPLNKQYPQDFRKSCLFMFFWRGKTLATIVCAENRLRLVIGPWYGLIWKKYTKVGIFDQSTGYSRLKIFSFREVDFYLCKKVGRNSDRIFKFIRGVYKVAKINTNTVSVTYGIVKISKHSVEMVSTRSKGPLDLSNKKYPYLRILEKYHTYSNGTP